MIAITIIVIVAVVWLLADWGGPNDSRWNEGGQDD